MDHAKIQLSDRLAILNMSVLSVEVRGLTHICLMDFFNIINSTSPFPILGVSGGLCLYCLPMSQKWDARLIWVN